MRSQNTISTMRYCRAMALLGIAALAASLLFSLGTAHADNRFGDGVGGAMGGTGSFGDGSVTIHHNLLPEERSEIDEEIAALKAMIQQQQSQYESEREQLNSKIQELESNNVRVGNLKCAYQQGRNTTYYNPGDTYGSSSCSGHTRYLCVITASHNTLGAKGVVISSSRDPGGCSNSGV